MHPDLPAYDTYKRSNIDAPAVMPSHWKEVRFRFLFSFGKGLNVTKENMQESGIPCLTYGDVHSRFGFEFDPCRDQLRCVSADFLVTNPSSLLSVGDFVFADTSEDIAGSGNFSQLINDGKVFAGYHTVIARPVEKNVPRFLAYFFDSSVFREQIRKSVKGVKVYSITKGVLKNLWVWLPKLHEQELIASYLDRKVEALDRAVRVKEQQITLLKERKQILIQNAVTRGLNPDAPLRDSGIEWIGKIPAHWSVSRAKYLFREVDERSDDGTEELLSVSHMTGVTPRSEKNVTMFMAEDYTGSKTCQQGDLVFNIMWAWMGALGVSDRAGIVSSSYGVFRQCDTDVFNPRYLEMLLKTTGYMEHYNKVSTGLHSSRLRFYPHMFMAMEIGYPDKKEQDVIVDYIAKESGKLDRAVNLLEQQITRLKEYKASLINSAVTGKIKVSGVVEPQEKEGALV